MEEDAKVSVNHETGPPVRAEEHRARCKTSSYHELTFGSFPLSSGCERSRWFWSEQEERLHQNNHIRNARRFAKKRLMAMNEQRFLYQIISRRKRSHLHNPSIIHFWSFIEPTGILKRTESLQLNASTSFFSCHSSGWKLKEDNHIGSIQGLLKRW